MTINDLYFEALMANAEIDTQAMKAKIKVNAILKKKLEEYDRRTKKE